jgi:hypothetical protein
MLSLITTPCLCDTLIKHAYCGSQIHEMQFVEVSGHNLVTSPVSVYKIYIKNHCCWDHPNNYSLQTTTTSNNCKWKVASNLYRGQGAVNRL